MEEARLALARVELDAGGGVILTAEDAARLLGAPLGAFIDDLRAGRVFSIVEHGEGEDAGRIRATLRRRGSEVRVLIEAATGRVLAIDGNAVKARDAGA